MADLQYLGIRKKAQKYKRRRVTPNCKIGVISGNTGTTYFTVSHWKDYEKRVEVFLTGVPAVTVVTSTKNTGIRDNIGLERSIEWNRSQYQHGVDELTLPTPDVFCMFRSGNSVSNCWYRVREDRREFGFLIPEDLTSIDKIDFYTASPYSVSFTAYHLANVTGAQLEDAIFQHNWDVTVTVAEVFASMGHTYTRDTVESIVDFIRAC